MNLCPEFGSAEDRPPGIVRMHTKDLARALNAFAGIADFDRSNELHRLAAFLERGKNKTIAARLKSTTPSTRYPLRLKESLAAIETGLRSAGAIKPSPLAEIQKLFAGRPGATVDDFLEEVSRPPQLPNATVRRFKSANESLAKSIYADLAAVMSDVHSFHARLAELISSTSAGTATWTLVANQFIGNHRAYRGRSAAIRAIKLHFDASSRHDPDIHGINSC